MKKNADGSSDVSFKNVTLRGKEMGEFTMSGDVSSIRSKGVGNPLVHKAAFSLVDNGIIDMVFAFRAQKTDMDASALRQQAAALVEAQRAGMPDPSLQKLNADITAQLKQPGGTLRMEMNPAKPISAANAQMTLVLDPASFGISSSFTPGK